MRRGRRILRHAVFGLFAKEDIVNKDGKAIVKADTQIERGVTGKDGKVTFTSDLPLGQYYVCLLYKSKLLLICCRDSGCLSRSYSKSMNLAGKNIALGCCNLFYIISACDKCS